MKKALLFLLFCHVSSPVKHSLKVLSTASTGIPDFPEFVSALLFDEIPAGFCDNKSIEVKRDVGDRILKDRPDLLDLLKQECFVILPNLLKARLNSFMQVFNQSGGVHVLQAIHGSEWDENTGEVMGFLPYGYDGEDFISIDLKNLTWTALKPEAVVIKQEWDADKDRMKLNVNYLTLIYPEWMKLYLSYDSSSLLGKVFLLQKTPSSPVSCHATGFYPDRATMFWRKDGEELHEDVDHGEILPNHDGTFQMSVDLNILMVRPEDWRRYDCVFQLSGVKNDTIIRMDKSVIRTNWVSPSKFPVGAIIGIVLGLVFLAIYITASIIWRKKNNGPDTGATVTIRNLMQDNSSVASTNSL